MVTAARAGDVVVRTGEKESQAASRSDEAARDVGGGGGEGGGGAWPRMERVREDCGGWRGCDCIIERDIVGCACRVRRMRRYCTGTFGPQMKHCEEPQH